MDSLTAMENAAKKQAQPCDSSWWAYEFEHIDNGILVTGSNTRPIKKGPRKGEPIPLKEGKKQVVITKAMIDAEFEEAGETPPN